MSSTPPPNNRGGRMSSTSSSTSAVTSGNSSSGQSHQLARQHYSITTHNGSPSPNIRRESSGFVVREPPPPSPTAAGNAPPPYSVVAPPPLPPPYSPTGSSMVENGAYESINGVLAAEQLQQEEVVVDTVQLEECEVGSELDKQQQQQQQQQKQWYNDDSNTSDFSTNHQMSPPPPPPPLRGLEPESRRSRHDIIPYNQVSNSEIASRLMMGEREAGTASVPRFSIDERRHTPFPYSEAVTGSSTESLSHLPQQQTMQTVPVEPCK